MAGSEWAKSQDGLSWLTSAVKTKESNWARVRLGLARFDSDSNWAKKSIWVRTSAYKFYGSDAQTPQL